MRLYHPTTLRILSEREDIPKRFSCSVWSEIFKWRASGQQHPKMFIDDLYHLGAYLAIVYKYATIKGCNLDEEKIPRLGEEVARGFNYPEFFNPSYFNDNYLFSDACSLYFKGVNIFPDIFGDDWRKYVPVESRAEILRQLKKCTE